jgi:Restriction endonuclease
VRVFLSVPARVDTSALRRVIEATGDTVVDYEDVNGSVREWLGSRAAWKGVDAVVAVAGLADGTRSDTVLIESGVALGRGIPLLVIYEDDSSLTAAWPPSVTIARTSLLNAEALSFHLKLFLAKIRRGPEKISTRPPRAPSIDVAQARRQLAQIREEHGAARGLALERWLAELFRASNVEAAEPAGGDRGFDFVLTLSEQAPSLGPIVVEVKSSTSPRRLWEVASRLHQVVLQERAALGLVLVDDDKTLGRFPIQEVPLVAVLGADELLDAISRQGSLSAVLVRLRNVAVHGL